MAKLKKFPKTTNWKAEKMEFGKKTLFCTGSRYADDKRENIKNFFSVQMKYLVAGRKKYDEKGRSSNPPRFPTHKPGFIWDKPWWNVDIIQDQVSVNIRLVGCSAKSRPLLPSRLFI